MDKDKINLLEVLPEKEGDYLVTLYDYLNDDYKKVEMRYTKNKWLREEGFYVCYIHSILT